MISTNFVKEGFGEQKSKGNSNHCAGCLRDPQVEHTLICALIVKIKLPRQNNRCATIQLDAIVVFQHLS